MATAYEDRLPGEDSDFSSMRDSFYILMNLNQYKMKSLISMTKESEGLLRIVLFSRDLRLKGTKRTLRQLREKLARELRSNRRKGVVPVFISTMWFTTTDSDHKIAQVAPWYFKIDANCTIPLATIALVLTVVSPLFTQQCFC